MNNTRYLELDFYRTGYRSVKAHQYDKDTRFISITCVNDAAVYPLNPDTMTCNLKLVTPDGRHMWKAGAIQADGTILITLEESMLTAAGICKAELNVYDLERQKLLSTMPFDLIVVGSVYDNSVIEGTDEFNVLNDLLFKAHGLFETLKEHIANFSNPHKVTKTQIGLGNVPNVTTNNQTPTYTESDTLASLASGEKLSVALGKVSKAVTDLISHIANKNNPHQVTKAQVGLGNVDNTADKNKPVSTKQQTAIDAAYQQSTGYTDQKIAELINGAPNTLDTLGEIAKAMQDNAEVVAALDTAIGSKADQAELEGHIGNGTIHITASERTGWNNKMEKTGNASNTTVAFSQAASRANISSGEKLSSIFGKIMKWFADLKNVAFTGSYNDLSDKPAIPTKTSQLTNDSGFKTTDNNTWKANTASSEGYVASGSGQANKVWKTDANGNPAWRDDKSLNAVAKTGDTMSGTLNSSKTTGTYLAGNQGQAIINSTSTAGAYTMLDKLNSTNGYFTDGVFQNKRLLQYTAKSTVDANTNNVTKSLTLLDEDGNSSFPGTVTATSFNGNANSASKLQTARSIKIGNTSKSFDGSGNVSWTLDDIGAAISNPYGVCYTESGQTDLNVTVAGTIKLTDGWKIRVRFMNLHQPTSTDTVFKLNVNNTGARTIRSMSGSAGEFHLQPGRIYEFMYWYNSWNLLYANDDIITIDNIYHGVKIALKNYIGADGTLIKKGANILVSSCLSAMIATSSAGYPLNSEGMTETFTLGTAQWPWTQLYAIKAPVLTSDKNLKNSISNIDPIYLDLFDRMPIRKYILNDGAKDTLTTTKNQRYHLGTIAQDAEKVIRELNMTSNDFSGVCSQYFAQYGSFKATIHGGWRENKNGYDYSDNVYNWKHRNDPKTVPYKIYNEVIEESIDNLKIDSYRKNIGYIMIEDNSKLTKEQPPITINKIALVGFDDSITPLKFSDFIQYFTVDDENFNNPLSNVKINDDGSVTISFNNKMYASAWLKLSEVTDITKYKSVMIDADYIGEYTIIFIPDGKYQNANPYDRVRNDQIIYDYSFRYDELFNLTAYTLQETRKEFNAYKKETQRTIEFLTEKVDKLLRKVGE